MIYNLSKKSFSLSPAAKDQLRAGGVDPYPDYKYFFVELKDDAFSTPDGNYIHPSKGDVIVDKDVSYGVDSVVSSKKTGQIWEFSLIIHELKKSQYSATKTFTVPKE